MAKAWPLCQAAGLDGITAEKLFKRQPLSKLSVKIQLLEKNPTLIALKGI
jgi:hypothetical protein